MDLEFVYNNTLQNITFSIKDRDAFLVTFFKNHEMQAERHFYATGGTRDCPHDRSGPQRSSMKCGNMSSWTYVLRDRRVPLLAKASARRSCAPGMLSECDCTNGTGKGCGENIKLVYIVYTLRCVDTVYIVHDAYTLYTVYNVYSVYSV